MQEPQKDYYGLLDIAPDASEIVIKKAYKRLALRYHPDKNSEDANAQENFQILQEAYDVLIDLESRELYNLKRDLWGFLPNMFLPPAAKSEPPSKSESKNKDIKEAFRKARLREQLEAARLRAEKEKLYQEEANRLFEQEKLQALAAERIRAAREALQEEKRLEEDMKRQARDQERLHRVASERIRNHRDFKAREEAKKKEEEIRNKMEEKREEEVRAENRRREEETRAEQRRKEEEELAEKLRQFGLKTPKGIAPNNWSEVEIDCLLQWKREGVTWMDIAQNMNAMFNNSRSAGSCRKKYVKMERAGET